LENPDKRKKLITLIKSLQAEKVPIHAIGSQAHINVSTTFETMDQALTEISTLGLPIHITELDVNSAAGGQRAFGADIADNSWRANGKALLFDGNCKPKPAFDAVIAETKKLSDQQTTK